MGDGPQRLERAKKALGIILAAFAERPWASKDPYAILIQTILSQHTSDVNSERAFKGLRRRFAIKPEALAKAGVREIAKAIRPAGLYRQKAVRIKQVSKIIVEGFGGSLSKVLKRPYEEARGALLALPGVGYKTADIVLAFAKGVATIPIDTHVERVSKRLKVVGHKAGYEAVRLALEELIPAERRQEAHLALISFGRSICKARRPLCHTCPVNELCPSAFKFA